MTEFDHSQYADYDGDVELHSEPAEMSVLGCCMISPTALRFTVATLSEGDFYRPAHRRLYAAVVALHDRGVPLDFITLANELKDRGDLANVGGPDYLTEIELNVPSAAHFESYVGIVKEKAARRETILIGKEIIEMANRGIELLAIEEVALGMPARVLTNRDRKVSVSWAELVQAEEGEKEERGVSTGNPSLDALLPANGMTRGQITLSTAPSGGGKTTWALGAIFAALDRGERCAFLSFADLPRRDIRRRALRYKCGIESWKKATAHESDDQPGDRDDRIDLFRMAQSEIEEWDFEVFDAESMEGLNDFETARAWLTRIQDEGLSPRGRAKFDREPKALSIVGWDYAQEIQTSDRIYSKRSVFEQQSWIAKRCRVLAAQLNVATIMCAQLTVNGDTEYLRDSKSWEHVCELWLRIHDDGLEIRKRRYGGKTTIRPPHHYHPSRWTHVPDGGRMSDALRSAQ